MEKHFDCGRAKATRPNQEPWCWRGQTMTLPPFQTRSRPRDQASLEKKRRCRPISWCVSPGTSPYCCWMLKNRINDGRSQAEWNARSAGQLSKENAENSSHSGPRSGPASPHVPHTCLFHRLSCPCLFRRLIVLFRSIPVSQAQLSKENAENSTHSGPRSGPASPYVPHNTAAPHIHSKFQSSLVPVPFLPSRPSRPSRPSHTSYCNSCIRTPVADGRWRSLTIARLVVQGFVVEIGWLMLVAVTFLSFRIDVLSKEVVWWLFCSGQWSIYDPEAIRSQEGFKWCYSYAYSLS